ncbi:phospholipase carboxylesterase [Ophiostoma piceae UAMH 11346]|uniref:Phospholipase carboxylesterase n=1 Tax=Ophiostoma piceae (strain UAMH 11346) TaxID=1262450 RepID=S3C340_OPHP1|nr:phospholipase carboxylesterase [Ophiostoma piceae UAMH 11346]
MPIPSSLSRSADAAVRKLADFGHTHPTLFIAAAVAGVTLPPTLLAVFRAAARSYHGYLDVGRGGIPHNIVGWMVQGLGQLIAIRDPLATLPFEKPSRAVLARYGDGGRQSYLETDLLPRAGAEGAAGAGLDKATRKQAGRPIIPAYVAPQRQISQKGEPATRKDQDAFLQSLAAANPDILDIRPSQLEGNETPALFAKQGLKLGTPFWSLSSQAARGPVEIVHTHAEGSTHMIFSLQDALRVVQNGWGERHLLAGSRGATIPLTYLIVYAPRDDVELMVWKTLALASVRFCVGGVELNEGKQ